MTADSTNIEDFKRFIKLMADNLVPHTYGGTSSEQDSAGHLDSNEPSKSNNKR